MYSTQFAFLVCMPVFSGLEQHGAFRCNNFRCRYGAFKAPNERIYSKVAFIGVPLGYYYHRKTVEKRIKILKNRGKRTNCVAATSVMQSYVAYPTSLAIGGVVTVVTSAVPTGGTNTIPGRALVIHRVN